MDGLAIRPAMLELGERLVSYGYFVLLPDLFYRSGPYEPMDPHTDMSDTRAFLVAEHVGEFRLRMAAKY